MTNLAVALVAFVAGAREAPHGVLALGVVVTHPVLRALVNICTDYIT